MPRLTKDIKIYIIQQLAMYRDPQEIVESVKVIYNVKPTLSQVCYYKPEYGKISKTLQTIFDETREKFRAIIMEIPIAHLAYRLWQLQESLDRAQSAHVVNDRMVLRILEQAAKESGGIFEKRREITRHREKDPADPFLIAKDVMAELMTRGWKQNEAVKFVSERYNIEETQLISDVNN
jgi:hypothetical protein